MTSKTIFIDESGNFGKSGRYFTISGVVFDDELKTKEIKKAKSRIGDAKKNNSTCVSLNGELKANSMAYEERKKLLNRLNNLNFEINYITLDLNHMYGYLSKNQNIFYNYLTKFIVKPILDADSELDKLNIILDMRNASVKASKNFSEYIQIMIWGEWGYKDVEVEVQYIESQNSIGLQCADYVANAIYVYYEKDNPSLVECIKPKIRVRQKFPYKKFGC